jgi:hypothetical protein
MGAAGARWGPRTGCSFLYASLIPAESIDGMHPVGIDGLAGASRLFTIMALIGNVADAPDSLISSPCRLATSARLNYAHAPCLLPCLCHHTALMRFPTPFSPPSGTFFPTLLLRLDYAQSAGRFRVLVPLSRLACLLGPHDRTASFTALVCHHFGISGRLDLQALASPGSLRWRFRDYTHLCSSFCVYSYKSDELTCPLLHPPFSS